MKTMSKSNSMPVEFQNAKPEIKAVVRKIRATPILFGNYDKKQRGFHSFRVTSGISGTCVSGASAMVTLVKEFLLALQNYGTPQQRRLVGIVANLKIEGDWTRTVTNKVASNADRNQLSALYTAAGLVYADHPDWEWTCFDKAIKNYTTINIGPGTKYPRFGNNQKALHYLNHPII